MFDSGDIFGDKLLPLSLQAVSSSFPLPRHHIVPIVILAGLDLNDWQITIPKLFDFHINNWVLREPDLESLKDGQMNRDESRPTFEFASFEKGG